MTEQNASTGECYPLSIVPGLSRLFLDYASAEQPLSPFYAVSPVGDATRARWTRPVPALPHSNALADLLTSQNHAWEAGPHALENISKLRAGARAIVTGQQVSLFGGPLYTLHKAATAIRLAQQATAATGTSHIPIFWLATEDHDFAEADHVQLRGRSGLTTVRVTHPLARSGAPVGSLLLGQGVHAAIDHAAQLLGRSDQWQLLARCYRPEATFTQAFAQWLAATFREHGLIVLDASGRACHELGREVLRSAILRAEELQDALLERGRLLTDRGYHTQVLVSPGSSLLFLLEDRDDLEDLQHTKDDAPAARRLPLKRKSPDTWTAGRTTYSTAQLLAILDEAPERLSPNALLRPVFQDALLPTAAYVGGPAEIAYFAQTSVLHDRLLGRVTPVLPRLSATLIDAPTAAALRHFDLQLPDIFATRPDELVQKMGARSMPLEGKRRLASAGNALGDELEAVTGWMRTLDENLGRSADVAASKMRYQMNRLRRLAANYQLTQDAGIRRKVDALFLSLYPGQHLQERALGAASALAHFGSDLPSALIAAAAQPCPGHKALYL